MIVIGSGPAGLAVAAMLRQQGHQPTVLEQSTQIGGAWPGQWDGLRLHTMRALSGLPGAPIPRGYGRWVSRDDFVSYLLAYAAHFRIDPELGVRATRVDRDGAGWRVSTTPSEAGTGSGPPNAAPSPGQDWSSEAVVVATGYSNLAFIPDWPGLDSYPGPLIHSTAYRNAEPFRGQRVLVVGAGNSAAEIAAELVEGGATVDLSVRTPPNIIRRSTLGVPSQLIGLSMRYAPESVMNPMSGLLRRFSVPDLRPFGLEPPADGFSQFLRTRTVPVLDHGFVDHVRAGDIRIRAAVTHWSGRTVELVDGSTLAPEAVICATGFTTGLRPLVGHLGVLDDRGVPRVHGGATWPDLPGLHFVGITVELSGLLREIGREARDVSRVLTTTAGPARGRPGSGRPGSGRPGSGRSGSGRPASTRRASRDR